MKTAQAIGDQQPTTRLGRDPAFACVVVLGLMGVFAYIPLLLGFLDGMLEPGISLMASNRDFANYWMGARLTHSGEHLSLFSQPVYFARMQEMFGPEYPIHNWGYPPHLLLLLWPLGFLEYKPAMIVFLVSTLVLFAASAALFRRVYAPTSNPVMLLVAVLAFTLMMVDTAQNGFLTAAALLFGFSWMRTRPMLAGIAFAVLTIKPQLGFLIPLLLVLDRNWKTLGWAAAFSVIFIGASVAMLGLESWRAYVTETIPYQGSVMTDWYGIFLAMMPTVFGSIRTLGFSPDSAWTVQLPVTLAAAAYVVWLLLRERDPLLRVFIVAAGTLVISPYAFNYDMGALTVAGAVLAGSHRIRSRPLLVAIALSAALAPAVMNLGRTGVPLSPLVLASALVGLGVTSHARAVGRDSGYSAMQGAP